MAGAAHAVSDRGAVGAGLSLLRGAAWIGLGKGGFPTKRPIVALVSGHLSDDNSPEQISGWLRRLHPDNEAMQLSHETIYRSLYV